MPRRTFRSLQIILALALNLATLSALASSANAADRYRTSQVHMGTRFTITLHAPGREPAAAAFKAAFDRIDALDSKLSDYQANSELNRLCRQAPTPQPVEVSRDLYRVLSTARSISQQSDGAFDVTVGPLTRLWRTARQEHKLPDPHLLAEAKRAVGYRHLELSHREGKYFVKLLRPGMQIDLGGIAKGYALDEALATLKQRGIDSALIDGGGDVACSAPPPESPGWRIGIAPLEPKSPPSQLLTLANRGVATSGDAWQFVEIEGHRYSHIVNPLTGLGLEQRNSVTVIAPNGMLADALASAVSVLGPEAGIELIDDIEQVESMIVVADDNGVMTYSSSGMTSLLPSENEEQVPAGTP